MIDQEVHTGTFMGLPANGMQVAFQTVDIFRIAGIRIVERWAMPDQFGLHQQLQPIS